jgi:hypothetical protein
MLCSPPSGSALAPPQGVCRHCNHGEFPRLRFLEHPGEEVEAVVITEVDTGVVAMPKVIGTAPNAEYTCYCGRAGIPCESAYTITG